MFFIFALEEYNKFNSISLRRRFALNMIAPFEINSQNKLKNAEGRL